jgi:hypothetical protein
MPFCTFAGRFEAPGAGFGDDAVEFEGMICVSLDLSALQPTAKSPRADASTKTVVAFGRFINV